MKCPSGHTGQVWVSETASGSFSAAPRQGKSAPRVAVPPLLATQVRYRLLPGQLALVRLHLRPWAEMWGQLCIEAGACV